MKGRETYLKRREGKIVQKKEEKERRYCTKGRKGKGKVRKGKIV